MNVPSGYTALGLIGFTDQGVYNSATAYVRNDIVHYNGNLWRCLVDDTTAVTPAEGANWTVYLAEPTSAAEDIIAPVEATATSTRIYVEGDQLILADVLYNVTQAIGIGDSLAVGTNIAAADTIVEQIAEKANSADLANVATTGAYSDLSGNPTLGTAAAKNVPASGDASTTEVVMGNDTRLTNARNAADVSAWAKAANKPTYNGSEISTSTAKTGTAQQSITGTVVSGTSMDNVVGTMLDNDKTLDTNVTSLKETFTNNGAHNLFDLSTYTLKNATFTLTNTGIRIQSESDGTSRRVSFLLSNIKKNTNFIFSSSVIETSGESWLVIKNVDTSYNIVDKALTAGDNTVNFNTGSANSLYIILYCTHNTSATGDVTYNNLMIRLASDTDSTYQPYAATNQQLTGLISNDFTNGAVNLLPNKVSSQVINGITFTVNSDGTVIVNASSAASADTKLTFINKTILEEIRQRAGGRIKFCGCPSGGSASSYVIYAHTESNKYPIDIGQGAILDEATVDGLAIQIKSGYQPTNLVFKPMITLADMPNSDYNHYVPYAMSNKELTDEMSNKYLLIGTSQTKVTADGVKTYQELMLDLFTALNTYFIANPKNYYRIISLGIGARMLRSNANGQLLMRGGGGVYTMRFDSVAASSGHYFMFYAETSPSSLSANRYFTIDNGTVTVQNSVVPTSGTEFIVYYDIYKLV